MKAYSQFLKELPSKKVVFAFGAFQPPTISHELLVKTVDNLATEQRAAKAIYATINEDVKKNPIPTQRKTYYLKRMFPEANIKTAQSLVEVAKSLNEKYKNIVMVAPSDRVAEYQKLLEKHNGGDYNFDSIMVVSSGQLDPDADTSKIREAVKKGDFELFKESMPQNFTSVDTKRLMNEMRLGMGLELIKDQVKLATDWLRESYYRGEIFKIGQVVESAGQQYEIIDRGSNYLVVVDDVGNTQRKWITDVQVVENYNPVNSSDLNTKQVSYKGYTTKNFDTDQQVKAVFDRLISKPDQDPVTILNLVKSTDAYLGVAKQAENTDDITKQQEKVFGDNLQKSQELLVKLGDLQYHIDYINHSVHTVQQVKAKYHTATSSDTLEESQIQGVTMISFKQFNQIDESERVARKPGQPANSKQHSDLYTDENPKGTITGLKFATADDAKASVSKINNSGRSHAHKIQAAIAMEQRAKVMGKSEAAAVYRKFIDSKKANEEVDESVMYNIPNTDRTDKQSPAQRKSTVNDLMKFVKHIGESSAGVKKLEASLRKPIGYDAIDQMMQTISKESGISPKELHDAFVKMHGMKPDDYAKKKNDLDEGDTSKLPRQPKDKTSGLPKKYVAGVSKSTAKARAAHFNKANKLSDSDPNAYKPAPGDATAKTKLSKHTLKYRAMYGEDMNESSDAYEQAEDHKVKAEMAKGNGNMGAYHAHMVNYHELRGHWHASKSRYQAADKEYEKAGRHHNDSLKHPFQEEVGELEELSMATLTNYKKKAGESASAADKAGNYALGNKRFSGIVKATKKQLEKDVSAHMDEACWDTHKQVGMKKKGDRMVPDCRPKNEEVDQMDESSWSDKYKKSIDCSNPKGFSQKAHCAGKKKNEQFDYEYAVSLLDEAISTIDKGEYDYEGAMARTQLQTLVRNSQELINMLTMDENMPEWVQSKVTLAQDYISSVTDYLKSRKDLGESTAINRPDLGMSDGTDVFKYADLARILGAQKPFSSSGERSNDDLEAKYGDTPLPDVKQAMAGKTSQTSQIPLSQHTQKTRYRLGEQVEFEELDEQSFYEEIDAVAELEDVIDAYEDRELILVDEDTDEEYELSDLDESVELDEAISRMDRIRRKARFARTKSKREMRTKIALKKTSSMPVLNSRAKRLAINMIKKRMLKKDPSTASVQEKERVENFIKSRPQIVQRLARRLVPRVRQVEKARLRGKKYKGTM